MAAGSGWGERLAYYTTRAAIHNSGAFVSRDIVRLVTLSGNLEAQILRGFLEANGVVVLLSGESASTAYGLGVGPLAQIDLMVPEEQLSEARQLLEDYYSGALNRDPDSGTELDE